MSLNYNRKYKALPQFSESDSDIDIFNATSHTGGDNTNERNSSLRERRKACILTSIGAVCFIGIVIAVSFHFRKSSTLSHFSLVVHTECGLVAGFSEVVPVNNNSIKSYVFKGIPYAKPPTHELRWKPPVRLSDDKSNCWKGVLHANKSAIKCVQGTREGSEDCLYLHVFTPTLSDSANLPVFVWIYGGYLMDGYADQKGYSPDSEFVSSMNVVAVSMNYRVNAFGFLTLEELWQTGTSYGNYGLMDQILALKWVQNNIKNFGGNPNSVTISGQSSGGTSIFGLLASPMADGLFHKAIPMSGSPKFEKSYKDAAKDNRIFVSRTKKCNSASSKTEIHDCLYKLTADEVFSAIPQNQYPFWAMDDLLDFPKKDLLDGALVVIDGIVVAKPPKYLSGIKLKQKVSVLIGNTAQELGADPKKNFNGEDSWTTFDKFISKRVDAFSPNYTNVVLGTLYNNRTRTAQYVYETMATDVRVTCPTNKLAKDFAKSNHHDIYRYIVTHGPYKPIKYKEDGHVSHHAFHEWDSDALFGFKSEEKTNYVPNKDDIMFKNIIRQTFRYFMKYGHLKSYKWEPNHTGVFGNGGKVQIITGDFHETQCKFWNNGKHGFVPYAWIN